MKTFRSSLQIKKILDQYKNSGLSKRQFCKEKNIPIQSFYTWINKEQIKDKNNLEFVSLSTASENSTPIFKQNNNSEKILLISLELPESISPTWLSTLLKDLV